MLLAVDVGNTNTVLGLFEDHELAHSWRIRTDPRTTADEMALTFRGLLTEVPTITGIALCSTVPAVLREMRTMMGRYWDHVPHVIVEPGVKTGVPLLTDNPKEVGSDRIVNTLAVHHLFGGPAIVVDFGTSTNLDVVSARGVLLGGALAPGIETITSASGTTICGSSKPPGAASNGGLSSSSRPSAVSSSSTRFTPRFCGRSKRTSASSGSPTATR